ncbi:MAG: AIR synthase related protein [Planctomycetota bacterium]
MREQNLIRAILERFPRPASRHHRPFTSDAEIVSIGDTTLAITVDEFSAEDGLSAAEPWPLGRNLAVAVVSDLLAVGAEPRVFLDALVVDDRADEAWVGAFADGLKEALDETGAELVGGDFGTGDAWRFTGFALGAVRGKPMRRIPAVDEGVIVATGRFGDGNLAAVTGATPHFECRLEEARALRNAGAACIDTSDGLANALATMADLTPDLSLTIDRGAIHYEAGVAEAATEIDLPPEAFLLGSAGEYELLALVPATEVPDAGSLRPVGTFTRLARTGVHWRDADGRLRAQPPLPDPRAPGGGYREEVAELAVSLFGGRP